MKLDEMKAVLGNEAMPPRKAPEFIIWIPPSGSAVECPEGFDVVQAGAAASRIASRHPGATVAVYRLEGTAIAPIVEPPFTPAVDEPFQVQQHKEEIGND